MPHWLANGTAIAAILAGMALEALALTLLHRRTGAGISPALLLPNLAAGAALLTAAALALRGTPWPWIALALLTGLIFHLLDLRTRWTPSPSPVGRGPG